ncbi:MAG: hypothetical protein K0U66_11105 [Gammaproteobacteria bacterium]|nr:hypothetical protein [Pseudomonadota bacterium]MCH9664185.1 hypothetical protein [Gammaproteobacteria bacterium]
MRKTNIILLLGVVALIAAGSYWRFVGSGAAQDTTAPVAPAPPVVAKPNIHMQSRNDFSAFLREYLPRSMCKDDTYFRRCYLVSQEMCLTSAEIATRECLDGQAKQMGEVIRAGEDVRYWQTLTGQCAGKFYDRQLAQYIKKEEDCLR